MRCVPGHIAWAVAVALRVAIGLLDSLCGRGAAGWLEGSQSDACLFRFMRFALAEPTTRRKSCPDTASRLLRAHAAHVYSVYIHYASPIAWIWAPFIILRQ